MAQAQVLQVRETLQSWQTALAHARRADDLWAQGRPLTRIPHMLVSLGRLDEAEAVALEACELTRKTQDWAGYSLALSALTCHAVTRGDFTAAERHGHETLLMVYRARYPWGGSRALFALACARALRGAWSDAEDVLDMLVEPGRVFEEAGPLIRAFVRVFRQLLRAYAGAPVEGALEPFAADLVQTAGIDSLALAPFCALVEPASLMGAPSMAEQPYRALSLAAERGVVFSGSSPPAKASPSPPGARSPSKVLQGAFDCTKFRGRMNERSSTDNPPHSSSGERRRSCQIAHDPRQESRRELCIRKSKRWSIGTRRRARGSLPPSTIGGASPIISKSSWSMRSCRQRTAHIFATPGTARVAGGQSNNPSSPSSAIV